MEPGLEAYGLNEPGDDPRQLATTNPGPASGASLRAFYFFSSRDTCRLTEAQTLQGRLL